MTDIINLNKARKAKLKQSQKAQAVQNRVRFGISTHARAALAQQTEKSTKRHEQNKLDTTDSQQKNVDEEQ